MTELELYIKSCFDIVEPRELEMISSLFKPETINRGDFFLKANRRCDKLSFVKSGFLRVLAETDKKEVTQWISTKGYFITDLSAFIFRTPSRWTIQALTDTEIYTISIDDYNKIGSLIPKWLQVEKLFIVRCFTILEDRIFSHLSMTTEERYNDFFEHHKELFNQVPLQYIASMLGMTAETFSRIRKKQVM